MNAQAATLQFGLQPICDVIWDAGYNLSQFADMTGLAPRAHVIQAMKGACPPNRELRQVAPQLLDHPLDSLFTAELLAMTDILERDSAITAYRRYDPCMGPSATQYLHVDPRTGLLVGAREPWAVAQR